MFILGKSYAKPGNKVVVTNGELERWDLYFSVPCSVQAESVQRAGSHTILLSSTSSLPSFSPSSTSWSWIAGSLFGEFVNLPACLPYYKREKNKNPPLVESNVSSGPMNEKRRSLFDSPLWRPLLLSRGEELASGGLGAGKVVISYQTGLLRWVDEC